MRALEPAASRIIYHDLIHRSTATLEARSETAYARLGVGLLPKTLIIQENTVSSNSLVIVMECVAVVC